MLPVSKACKSSDQLPSNSLQLYQGRDVLWDYLVDSRAVTAEAKEKMIKLCITHITTSFIFIYIKIYIYKYIS